MSGKSRDGGYTILKDYFIPQTDSPGGIVKFLIGKKYLWQMPLYDPDFGFLKERRKTSEGRVPDFTVPTKDYRKMSVEDMIEFQSIKENKVVDSIFAEIAKVRKYSSLEEFFTDVPFHHVMPQTRNAEEAIKEYLKFPGYAERIQKNGIYSINFNVLSNVKMHEIQQQIQKKSSPLKAELEFGYGYGSLGGMGGGGGR